MEQQIKELTNQLKRLNFNLSRIMDEFSSNKKEEKFKQELTQSLEEIKIGSSGKLNEIKHSEK